MLLKRPLVYTLFLCPALAFGTTTVTGHISNLDTTTPGATSFVRFWLRGTRGNEPRITGTGAIAPKVSGSSFYVDLPADSSGNVSGTIYSTRDSTGTAGGEIEVGGSYTAVYYGMQIYNSGVAGPEVPIQAKNGGTIDISSVTPTSTQPVVTAPSGDTTYARLDGGNTPFSGLVSFVGGLTATAGQNSFKSYSLNNRKMVDGIRYAYSTAGVNQCLADAQTTSGICDASGVPATTFTAQITVNAGETLIVPATDVSSWTWSGINDGTSCGIDVEGGGALLGTGPSNGNQTIGRFKLLTSGTVSMRGLLCGNISGTSNYLRIEPGLIVLPQTGASFAKGAIDVEGWFDASVLRNVSVSLTQDTTPNQTGLYAANLCCSASIERVVSDGGYQTGALPCHITYNNGLVATDSPVLFATSCDHPGSGKNAKLYDGTTTGPILDINGYAESSNTDTTTAVVSVTATKGGVTFIGGKVNILAAASTAYCYDLPNTAGNSAAFYGVACLSQSGGSENAINDHLNSFTSTSGPDGRIRDYKSGFGQTSGLIASGTAAMTTAAIASGACGTTVTVAATGVTTADAIEITPNASVTTPNGLLTLQRWPTSGNVNFAYCNPTAGSLTPAAATVNWRVSR